MKDFVLILVIILISFGVGMLLMHSCQEPEQVDHSEAIAILEADTVRSNRKIDSLEIAIDSLKKVIPGIRIVTIREIDTVDARIAGDSTRAIPEYRAANQLWGILPSPTDFPTYAELGWGAKNLREGYGFKLQVKEYETRVVPSLEANIKEHKSLYKSSQNLNKIKDVTINEQATIIEDGNAWYNSKFLWFGGGAVVTAILTYLAGLLGG